MKAVRGSLIQFIIAILGDAVLLRLGSEGSPSYDLGDRTGVREHRHLSALDARSSACVNKSVCCWFRCNHQKRCYTLQKVLLAELLV